MSLPALELVKKSIFDKLSNETHFVGLSFEKAAARRSALAYARTFASRACHRQAGKHAVLPGGNALILRQSP